MGTDLGIASLSKTLLTQEGSATLSVHRFNIDSFSTTASMEWNVSIPIGQDDAFDYQPIPDHNGDSIVDLAVLLAEEAQVYSSTSDSWRFSQKMVLQNRGNWVKVNHITYSQMVAHLEYRSSNSYDFTIDKVMFQQVKLEVPNQQSPLSVGTDS